MSDEVDSSLPQVGRRISIRLMMEGGGVVQPIWTFCLHEAVRCDAVGKRHCVMNEDVESIFKCSQGRVLRYWMTC